MPYNYYAPITQKNSRCKSDIFCYYAHGLKLITFRLAVHAGTEYADLI